MKSKLFILVIVAIGLIGMAGYLYWHSNLAAAPQVRAAADPSVPVVLATTEQRAVPVTIDVIGTVEAYSTVAVWSRLDGQLISAAFTEGQAVKHGDLLFTVDPRTFEALLGEAEATMLAQRISTVGGVA